MDKLSKLTKELFLFFDDDYMGLFHVIGIIEEDYFKFESCEELKKFTLDYTFKLLEAKFIKVGCLLDKGGFDEWKESPQEIIARIDQEWDGSRYESHGLPGLYGIWFDMTEQGKEELKRLKAME